MLKRRFAFLFCFLVFSSLLLAQKEASNWHFGEYANIKFVGNTITASNWCSFSITEGSSSISDSNGNLLFYTDGTNVFNKNSIAMPNGDSLQGSYTSTQSALIVPYPGNSLKYYVFAAGPQAGAYSFAPYAGITYSVVDMSLAGGFGDVTIKNQSLVTPACEKITAVKHCNQIDYWVIVHKWNSDAFYSYLVTSAGVSAPVITNIGAINQEAIVSGFNAETIGYLKASPNGKKIAAATYNMHKVEIFDFDNLTGILSNTVTIDYLTPAYQNTYGVSFSPDNSKLYVTTTDNNIYQYDMLAGSAAGIIASRYNVVTTSLLDFGALQIGPDNKIYVSSDGDSFLNRINNPNLSGSACDFQANVVSLPMYSYCHRGLPNFIDGIFEEKPYLDSVLYTCSFPITLDQTTRQKQYLWSNGDTTATININSAGTYWVTVQLTACTSVTDTVRVVDNSSAGFSTLNDLNVFSPNNDGINDEFGFKDIIGSDFKLDIYNRWGELVFSTTDANNFWDGTSQNGACSEGVYYWTAEFKRGAACNNEIVSNKGFVNLLR